MEMTDIQKTLKFQNQFKVERYHLEIIENDYFYSYSVKRAARVNRFSQTGLSRFGGIC